MALTTANYFEEAPSELLQRFVYRLTGGRSSSEAAISGLIAAVRKSTGLKGMDLRMEPYLKHRRVLEIEYVAELDCDGALLPLGCGFAAGFRMLLKKGCPSTRTRFTTAHELCHTFFYETVPELKFRNHVVDPGEERLCDLGAAELLMPSYTLRRQAKAMGKSLQSLGKLANLFDVSLEAMLLRLRSVAGWQSELSTWRHMTGGGFALHHLVGGRKVDWVWSEPNLLRNAWNTGRTLSGTTYLECRDRYGCLTIRPVFYELKRRRDSLLSLWSHPSTCRVHPNLPLFEFTQKHLRPVAHA